MLNCSMPQINSMDNDTYSRSPSHAFRRAFRRYAVAVSSWKVFRLAPTTLLDVQIFAVWSGRSDVTERDAMRISCSHSCVQSNSPPNAASIRFRWMLSCFEVGVTGRQGGIAS